MEEKRFRSVKREIRVLGVDDGVFVPQKRGKALIVGVVYRGGLWLDGVMHTEIEVDGLDATEKIASMIKSSPHYAQLRVIMLNGLTFAGFNIVDIKRLYGETGLPVIVVSREKPNLDEIKKALEKLPHKEKRWKMIENAGKLLEVNVRNTGSSIYVQLAGLNEKDARKIVRITSTRSNIPEPLRVAHLIASGITQLTKH
ncbi:MAG TPA: DUF99 family protein [Candidatus Bathyarchaeota archaeon]|nr:DUF99 family protein [Candidatus Bathyarchaeota archaeon]